MRLPLVGTVSCVALVSVAMGTVRAQVEHAPSFEVASVRLTAPHTGPPRPVTNVTATRVDMTNMPLRDLLWRAFRLGPLYQPARLLIPSWVPGVRVDIHATIPAGGTREQVPDMLKHLLVTRFGLRAHAEPRPTDAYALVVGSGGLRMQEVQPANELDRVFPPDPSQKTAQFDQVTNALDGPMRTIRTPRGTLHITERLMYERFVTNRGTTEIDAVRISMAELAPFLEMTVGRPVVDKTMLTGVYRLRIEIPPVSASSGLLASLGISRTADGAPLSDPTGVSVFRAVEQLGLKLEPRRLPVDTIVVDHIERVPTEN